MSTKIGAEQIGDYIKVNSDTTTTKTKTADALEFKLHVDSESGTDNKKQ